jgi:hypothetical protein
MKNKVKSVLDSESFPKSEENRKTKHKKDDDVTVAGSREPARTSRGEGNHEGINHTKSWSPEQLLQHFLRLRDKRNESKTQVRGDIALERVSISFLDQFYISVTRVTKKGRLSPDLMKMRILFTLNQPFI